METTKAEKAKIGQGGIIGIATGIIALIAGVYFFVIKPKADEKKKGVVTPPVVTPPVTPPPVIDPFSDTERDKAMNKIRSIVSGQRAKEMKKWFWSIKNQSEGFKWNLKDTELDAKSKGMTPAEGLTLAIAYQFLILPTTNPNKISNAEYKSITDVLMYKLSFDGISNEDKNQW